jgi:NADH-quinone oxidoreductase subunit M
MVESVFKLFYQIDLKKLVAYSTVVEMHWLVICVISGQSPLIMSGLSMMVAHALMSTGAFLVVDAIARRYKTRLITEIGGLCFLCPKLFIVTLAKVLVFLGFPGSLFFVSEFMFFSFMIEFLPLMAAVLILLLYLIGPVFLFRSWMNIMFGFSAHAHQKVPTDLSLRELLVLGFLLGLMFWLGLVWPTLVL